MGRLILESPEILRIKHEIEENLIRAEGARQLGSDMASDYGNIAEANMALLYTYQDIRNEGKRELWLPGIKAIPVTDEKLADDMSVLDSGQSWIPCSVCGQTGLYQYTDYYATFVCYSSLCRSWYEIYKNQTCPQCSYPKLYRYYYDNRVAPHVRCVTQWQQCTYCSYHTDRTYYWYYD